MARKRGVVEVGAVALLATCLAACASGAELAAGPDRPVALTILHPRTQGWTDVRACVEPVCASARTSARRDVVAGRLLEVEVSLGAGGAVRSWAAGELEGLDDPVLHLMRIQTTWGEGETAGASDLIEVIVPFGFVRKRLACGDEADIDDISDRATFSLGVDGRSELDIERIECGGDE